MTFTYNMVNPGVTDMVRLRINDTDLNNPTFQDEELEMFLSSEIDYDWRLGAAAALETLATRYVVAVGVVKILGVQADGSKVANVLNAKAQEYRDLYEQDPDAFDYVEWPDGDFAQRERLENDWLRRMS